ncbi:unnamed protein product, partial [marine sediment metagenome]
VAQLAGIMAAKRTPHIIPLCHPVLIGDVRIEFNLDEKNSAVEITTMVKSLGKTGVEMEALTATAVAALTIYDMCKAVDRARLLRGSSKYNLTNPLTKSFYLNFSGNTLSDTGYRWKILGVNTTDSCLKSGTL